MADSPRTMEAHHLSSSSVAERELLGQLASLGSDVTRYAVGIVDSENRHIIVRYACRYECV